MNIDCFFSHRENIIIPTILLRIVIAVMFVMFVIEKLFQTSTTLLIGIAVVLVGMMMFLMGMSAIFIYATPLFLVMHGCLDEFSIVKHIFVNLLFYQYDFFLITFIKLPSFYTLKIQLLYK